MKKQLWVMVGITAVLLLALTGCIGTVSVGPTQTENQSVERGDADSVRAEIEMGVGELTIGSGSENLMDAAFTFNVEAWRPEVAYEIRRGEGQLAVTQPDVTKIAGIPDDDVTNSWDLRFVNDTPLNLIVDLGVGSSDLVLGDLLLTEANINVGVGETEIDLTGDWRQSAVINVTGGVGSTSIRLPANAGVRVETETGLGSIDVYGLIRNGDVYTNALYGSSDVELDIHVTGGVGEIRIESES